MNSIIDFALEFGLLAILIVVFTAFMGIVSTKIAEAFGGKKKDKDFDMNERTKQGWKSVGGKNS